MSSKDSFYDLQAISGILLFSAAILALIIVNSPLQIYYQKFFSIYFELNLGVLTLKKTLLHWVNDGLMVIYFLLMGLEIKRETTRGILYGKALVPAITAFCGLIVPAIIFILFNRNNTIALHGWAIPTATDIAFTLGIVSLLKKDVPQSLKVLLTAIAIFDDVGAIIIIAIFYTHDLSFLAIILGLICTSILITLNYFKVQRVSLYMVVGFFLWVSVLKSGVHATLAGIIIALCIPDIGKNSTLVRLENGLHPWIVFFILPAFAFANAGINFTAVDPYILMHPIVLGIIFGLFFGKQIGIFFPLLFFQKKLKLIPENIKIYQLYGLAIICGVGFTMSLFIGSLAYREAHLMNFVKIGVFSGSLLSAIVGYLVITRKFHKLKILLVKLVRK